MPLCRKVYRLKNEPLETVFIIPGDICIPIVRLILEFLFGGQHLGAVRPVFPALRSIEVEILDTQVGIVYRGQEVGGIRPCASRS